VHGHVVDWRNYARVLPALSARFHVFAVDLYGHGGSARATEKYSAAGIGADLARFIEEVIRQPVIVSGHSGGGLVTAWIAANAPRNVRGVILEDPPLFTTLLPRALKTWNQLDIATAAHEFLASGESDFTTFYAKHSRLLKLFKGLQPAMTAELLASRARHPTEPASIYFMPPLLNEFLRGLDRYDPRFGDTFYRGTWDIGFDHAEALAHIAVPTVLIHANWAYDDEGVLQAAMDDRDAARARSLLHDVEFHRVDSGHGFHFEKPEEFVRIVVAFGERLGARGAH